MIYSVLVGTVLVGLASLAVDLGRVSQTKSELQAATDAAARYAASGVRSSMNGTSGAAANASAVFNECVVDGSAYAFDSNRDLSLGIWNSSTRTFTPATVAAGANAVKLTTSLTLGPSTHPLFFLSYFNKQVTVTAQSVAMVNGSDATTAVSAKGNPWLAGMPAGTVCTNFRTNPAEQDSAGSGPNVNSSPAMINLASVGVTAGKSITFDGVTGAANFGTGTTNVDADGNPALHINLGSPSFGSYSYFDTPMNGMSNCHAPINAMVAVFLDDSAPNSTAAPSTPLDFATAAARDYVSISPQLKQVFFIGDGRRSNGEVQQIVVPAGATRMFIANMDGWQYNDNSGGYNLTVHATQTISSVQLR